MENQHISTKEITLRTPESDTQFITIREYQFSNGDIQKHLVVGYGDPHNCHAITLDSNLENLLLETLSPHQYCSQVYGRTDSPLIKIPHIEYLNTREENSGTFDMRYFNENISLNKRIQELEETIKQYEISHDMKSETISNLQQQIVELRKELDSYRKTK